MEDEFEVVADESFAVVAETIMLFWTETSCGDFSTVDRWLEKWEARKGQSVVKAVRGGKESDSGDSIDAEDEDEDGDENEDMEDEEMDDAPELVPVKEKMAPQVDEEGFTKVVGKRRR